MNQSNFTYNKLTLNATISSTFLNLTFTGKEQDEETGYSYFGARYYDADLLTGWMSVDPMSDKYPSISPYAYCAWNPAKLVDLDGRDFDPTTEKKYIQPYEAELSKRIEYFSSISDRQLTAAEQSQFDECIAAKEEIVKLRQDHSTIYSIRVDRKSPNDPYGSFSYSGKTGNQIMMLINIYTELNPDKAYNYLGTLSHELKHAYQYYSGVLDIILLPNGKITSTDTQDLEKECFAREGMFEGVALINGGTINRRYFVSPSSVQLDKSIYGEYPTKEIAAKILEDAKNKNYTIIHHS